MRSLGRRIAGARIEAGLSQAELGAAAGGVSAAAVYKWEADKSEPDLAKLRAIADATGRPLAYFCDADEGGVSQSAVTIAGVPVSGPADKLAAIVAALNAGGTAQSEAAAHPAIIEKQRPNQRHVGIHRLLDIVDRGEFEARYRFRLEPDEELGLRTYGRSGPPVATVDEAIDLVLRWRGERIGSAPDRDGPEPGVVALREDRVLRETLGIGDEGMELLEALRWPGHVETAQDAARIWLSTLAAGDRMRAGDNGESE